MSIPWNKSLPSRSREGGEGGEGVSGGRGGGGGGQSELRAEYIAGDGSATWGSREVCRLSGDREQGRRDIKVQSTVT